MNKYLIAGVFASLLNATVPAVADEVPVTAQTEWNLSGKLRADASLSCRDPAPAPDDEVSQDIPSPVAVKDWAGRIQFLPDGGFKYWEIDAQLRDQPVAKWANYNGTWTQRGEKVFLEFDGKSATALLNTYSGGTKCGSNNPCFDKQRYRFSGISKTAAGGAKLALKQAAIFTVSTMGIPGQYRCSGHWRYTKALASE